MTISDETLAAYVDGELSAAAKALLDAALVDDRALSARLAAHLALRDRVNTAFSDVVLEPVPERLLRAATASTAPTANVNAFRFRSWPTTPTWLWASGGALAAGLALGIIITPAFLQSPGSTLMSPDMAARGVLADALDHQLASQGGRRPVKIGVTFRANDGHVCRTFDAQSVAGLACHDTTGGWTVRVAAPSQTWEPGAYQTAASGLPPPVAELAQSLAAAPPMSADEERRLKGAGWR